MNEATVASGNTYEIRTVRDFLAIPSEKLESCLFDLAIWVRLVRAGEELGMTVEALEGGCGPDAFGWLDDGQHIATVSIRTGEREDRREIDMAQRETEEARRQYKVLDFACRFAGNEERIKAIRAARESCSWHPPAERCFQPREEAYYGPNVEMCEPCTRNRSRAAEVRVLITARQSLKRSLRAAVRRWHDSIAPSPVQAQEAKAV